VPKIENIVNGQKQCTTCKQWKDYETGFTKCHTRRNAKCRECQSEYYKQYSKHTAAKERLEKYREEYYANPEIILKRKIYQHVRNKNKSKEDRQIQQANKRERIKENKLKAVHYKGGQCCICRYAKCMEALDFHHLHPEDKDHSLYDSNRKIQWDLKIHKDEIDKCILVCANCHREIHSGYHMDKIKLFDEIRIKRLNDIMGITNDTAGECSKSEILPIHNIPG
jgi:hypothetical protein